ncbi:hypothetical protein CspHIS471_0312460 [Cutaneotrichosporon sp. HIS471]|nr:hypothetical protein CspHIS471_0312460 [Cutaneotrichosporon sp. HIS471]
MPPRRSSRRASRAASYLDSEDEVIEYLTPRRPPSSRITRSSAAVDTPVSPSARTRSGRRQPRPADPDSGSDDGGPSVLHIIEDDDDDIPLTRPAPKSRRPLSSPPQTQPSSPSVIVLSDGGDPEPPHRMPRNRAVVEIPFLPLHVLEQYDLPDHLSLPTRASRKRVLAEQDEGSRWKLKLTPSKRKRRHSLSSDSGFGGYGDDTDDLHDEEDGWESDDSSSDGIGASRHVTRRSGRLKPEMMQTRSHRISSSPVATRFARTRSTAARSTTTRSARLQPAARTMASSRMRRESPDLEPFFEMEGEDELESDYESTSSPTPAAKLIEAPTRRILERHHPACDKCGQSPADVLLEAARRKKKKEGRKKRRGENDDFLVDDEEHAEGLGGWLECERCCASFHWSCIPQGKRKKVINAYNLSNDGSLILSLPVDDFATFLCSRCEAFPVCFVCKEQEVIGAIENTNGAEDDPIDVDNDDGGAQGSPSPQTADDASPIKAKSVLAPNLIASDPAPLLFRCKRCKQACHYEHLRSPFADGQRYGLPRLAEAYQNPTLDGGAEFECHVCRDWPWIVDRIIAWRPFPADAVEPELEPGELPNYRDRLPREYLLKWSGRGFRHATWVPHGWLVAVAPQKLRNFIEKGPQLDLVTDDTLAAKGDEMIAPTITAVMEEHEAELRRHREKDDVEGKWEGQGPPPDVSAKDNLPVAWCTADRVLDLWLFPPKNAKNLDKKGKKSNRNRVVSSSDEDELDDEVVHRDGIQPRANAAMWIKDWEELTERRLTRDDLDEIAPLITWSYVKWRDLQYDQACHDTPPPVDSPLYPAFKEALGRYLDARLVTVPVLTRAQCEERDEMAENFGDPPAEQPDCVVGGSLMPFQVEGFQWLLYKHFRREGCILADDMGLGKTIQVSSFLGYLASDVLQIYPSLVIVPNSTITNWVREFEKWVPHVSVVPYYGESASRKVISKYELYHPGMERKAAGLKAHVVLTTYDTITGADFSLFSNVPRLLFRKLKKLNAVHRVLLTGTPLNNNVRELFNLLNFLDEENFKDLRELEARFENLNETLVIELHKMLKPYILRRVKGDVLKLPPKVEIIVPISMTAPQRLLYKRILLKHRETINAILEQRKKFQSKKVETPVADQPQSLAPTIAVVDEIVEEDAPDAPKSAGDIEIVEFPEEDIEMRNGAGKGTSSATVPGTADTDTATGHGGANGEAASTANGSKVSNGNKTNEGSGHGAGATKPRSNGSSKGRVGDLTPQMDID